MSKRTPRCAPTTMVKRHPSPARLRVGEVSVNARIPGAGFSARGDTDNLLTLGLAVLGGALIVDGFTRLFRAA